MPYRFDQHELDPEARRLLRSGVPVELGRRVFDLIAYLIGNRHRAIGRDELISAVWGRTDGGDAILAQAVLKARRAFGDDGHAQHHIRTVPRFGYQWVAPIETTEVPVQDAAETRLEDGGRGAPGQEAAGIAAPAGWGRRRVGLAAALGAALLGAIVLAVWAGSREHRAAMQAAAVPAAQPPGPLQELILVLPTHVRDARPDDGWMRLGVMSLGAHALADLPGHAVVPDETAIAAAAQVGNPANLDELRARTGATLVVATEARREGSDWQLEATLSGPGAGARLVSARSGDPLAAAGSVANQLRDLLAPERGREETPAMPPDVLALATRMRAAILEGQNGRALALDASATATVAADPEVQLLRAEALTQLGHAEEAAALLRKLLDQVPISPAPRWLTDAWTALGDCELALGEAAMAEGHFRRAIAQASPATERRSIGLAWRGRGIAQVMQDDLDGAEASYLQARLALEPIGDRLVLARITDGLGYIAAQRGRLSDALLRYEEAARMAAAFGNNQTELGSRLNIAQSQLYLLHAGRALEQVHALLPRIRALDYPALHRFGLVAHARALAETGALSAARHQLDALASEDSSGPPDAVVDTRLDEAQVRWMIGDAAGALEGAEAIRRGIDADTRADLRLGVAALLLRLQSGRDASAAQALAGDASLWAEGGATAPARVDALVALAQWQAHEGRDAAAAEQFRAALDLARAFGAPIVLRDAAVPYATFQLARGASAESRVTARLVGPWAESDFAIALLLARVAVAHGDAARARSYFARAHALAGERWSHALAAEESAATTAGTLGAAR